MEYLLRDWYAGWFARFLGVVVFLAESEEAHRERKCASNARADVRVTYENVHVQANVDTSKQIYFAE